MCSYPETKPLVLLGAKAMCNAAQQCLQSTGGEEKRQHRLLCQQHCDVPSELQMLHGLLIAISKACKVYH